MAFTQVNRMLSEKHQLTKPYSTNPRLYPGVSLVETPVTVKLLEAQKALPLTHLVNMALEVLSQSL